MNVKNVVSVVITLLSLLVMTQVYLLHRATATVTTMELVIIAKDAEIRSLKADNLDLTTKLTTSQALIEHLNAMSGVVNAIKDVGIEIESIEQITDALELASKAPFGSPFKDDFIVTSPFGLRDETLWSGDGNHAGVDLIPVGGNRTIYYPADGIIESYDYDDTYGWNMWVNHGDYKTHYAHLRLAHYPIEGSTQIVGAEVKKGNRLGQMGASGFSYGAHLHYEIWIKVNDNFELLDPTEILSYLG